MQKVKCNHCNWNGTEDNLKVIEGIEYCPDCSKGDALMDDDISVDVNETLQDYEKGYKDAELLYKAKIERILRVIKDEFIV